MNNTVNERIREIADKLYGGNITAMAKAAFISRTTINSIIGEKEVSPGYDVIRRIADISSHNISMEWLITGKGEMLKQGKAGVSVGDNNSRVNIGSNIVSESNVEYGTKNDSQIQAENEALKRELEALKEQIALLKNSIGDKDLIISMLRKENS